jgi:hypothetical protein
VEHVKGNDKENQKAEPDSRQDVISEMIHARSKRIIKKKSHNSGKQETTRAINDGRQEETDKAEWIESSTLVAPEPAEPLHRKSLLSSVHQWLWHRVEDQSSEHLAYVVRRPRTEEKIMLRHTGV